MIQRPKTVIAFIKKYVHPSATLVCCAALILTSSCSEKSKDENVRNSADELFVGKWRAQGTQIFGSKHGKYAIHVDLKADGKAIMNVENHINTTAFSFKHSDNINLEGTWTSGYDDVSLKLKVTEWIVAYPNSYPKHHDLGDFFIQYDFKIEDDKMFLSRDIKIGTSEDALEGLGTMKTNYKGKAIIIPNVKFIK
jgi:hypothetical protein